MSVPRYPIERPDGTLVEDKYSITFTRHSDNDMRIKLMEEDPEFREMMLRQYFEAQELGSRHAQEMIMFIAKKRREQDNRLKEEAESG